MTRNAEEIVDTAGRSRRRCFGDPDCHSATWPEGPRLARGTGSRPVERHSGETGSWRSIRRVGELRVHRSDVEFVNGRTLDLSGQRGSVRPAGVRSSAGSTGWSRPSSTAGTAPDSTRRTTWWSLCGGGVVVITRTIVGNDSHR
jgi:hypothetical protein